MTETIMTSIVVCIWILMIFISSQLVRIIDILLLIQKQKRPSLPPMINHEEQRRKKNA